MGGLEHLRVLHPQPDQLRDAEEPPVVQLGPGQPPPHRAVPLGVQQLGQRQVLGARAEREDVVVVAQHVAVDRQVRQLRADRAAEHRQQHPAALRLPVDVEPARVRRTGPVAQHLPQGPVVPGRHRHVVRHDVHHQAEAVLARGARQRAQPLLAAQLLAHARGVHDVVAVHGARNGLQDRGQVQVRDAERRQVRYGRFSGGERERGLELQPVGGRGHRRSGSLRSHENLRTPLGAFRVTEHRPDHAACPRRASPARGPAGPTGRPGHQERARPGEAAVRPCG